MFINIKTFKIYSILLVLLLLLSDHCILKKRETEREYHTIKTHLHTHSHKQQSQQQIRTDNQTISF